MPEHTELLPDSLPAEPLGLVGRWLAEAWAAHRQPNANAMVLATSTPDGRPSARQVRIEGLVTETPPSDSDAYFASRSWDKRVGAWASEQSAPIASRAALEAKVAAEAARLGAPVPGTADVSEDLAIEIPRPAHRGGYR